MFYPDLSRLMTKSRTEGEMEKPQLFGWKIGFGKDLKDHRKLRIVRNHETIFVTDRMSIPSTQI